MRKLALPPAAARGPRISTTALWNARRNVTLVALAAFALPACSDRPTAPPRADDGSVSREWNALTRALVIAQRTDPPAASRAYAYVSVAQYAAAAATEPFSHGDHVLGGVASSRAAVAASSALVLTYLFPTHAARVAHEREQSLAAIRAEEGDPRVQQGERVGRALAFRVIERALADGSTSPWTGVAPSGHGYWTGTPQQPAWGTVKPWNLDAGSSLRAPPPPAYGSPAFAEAVSEVRRISDGRTAAQMDVARFWADGAGTYTPPGHWNEIAADLVRDRGFGELQASRTFALLNMAMMDAMIACWDSKFTYWVIRPYQADPGITTPVGQPPHPSYPSGHACSSGAGAWVLGQIFVEDAERLGRLAVEACDSRVYAGIHYSFDAEAGMAIGEAAGALASDRGDAVVREFKP